MKDNLLKYDNSKSNLLAKKYLKDALVKLLNDKNYDDIAISDICKFANVSRTAFYKNYKTKDNILKEIILELNESFLNKIGRPFNNLTKDFYLNFFNKVKEYSNIIKLIYNTNFNGRYLDIINNIIISKDDITNEEDKIKRLMWNGAMQNIVFYVVNHEDIDIDTLINTILRISEGYNAKSNSR